MRKTSKSRGKRQNPVRKAFSIFGDSAREEAKSWGLWRKEAKCSPVCIMTGYFEEIPGYCSRKYPCRRISHKLRDKTDTGTVYAKHDGFRRLRRPRTTFTQDSWKSNAKGCPDCTCNAPRGTWHFPAGPGEGVTNHRAQGLHRREDRQKLINRDQGFRAAGRSLWGRRAPPYGIGCRRRMMDLGISRSRKRWTNIFVYRVAEFKMIDGLITNLCARNPRC